MEGCSKPKGLKRKSLALIVPEQMEDVGQSSAPVIYMERDLHQSKQFSRMSPTQLRNFITDALSLEQKKDIESLGFGSLLELKTDEYPTDLCRWLLRHYNPVQSCLDMGKETLKIGADDFHVILGLPNVGQKVTELGKRVMDFEHEKQVNAWLSQFDKSRHNLTVSDIGLKLREQKTGGDSFKRNFVIFVVSTLLKSNQKGAPNLRIMKCLANVDLIGSFNWCQYALECLNDCSREWLDSNGVSRFTGPALPFVICYLDRVAIMGRMSLRRFPLLGCWEKKQIIERRAYELKQAGTYGKGQVRPRLVIDCQDIEGLDSHRDLKKVCLHQLAQSGIQLSKAFNSFVQSLGSAKLMFPNSNAITKLDRATMLMSEVFEEEVTEKTSHQEDQSTTVKEPVVDLEECFKDPLFVEAYDQMEKSLGKKHVSSVPEFDPINQPKNSELTGAMNRGKEDGQQGISCPLGMADHEICSLQPQQRTTEQPSTILPKAVDEGTGGIAKNMLDSLGIDFDSGLLVSNSPSLRSNGQSSEPKIEQNMLPKAVDKGKGGISDSYGLPPRAVKKGTGGISQGRSGLPLRTSPRLRLNSQITEAKSQQNVERQAATTTQQHQDQEDPPRAVKKGTGGISQGRGLARRQWGKEPSFSLGLEFDSDPSEQPQQSGNEAPSNILPKSVNTGKGGTSRSGLPLRTSPRLRLNSQITEAKSQQNVERQAATTTQQHQDQEDPLGQPRRSTRLCPTNDQCLGC